MLDLLLIVCLIASSKALYTYIFETKKSFNSFFLETPTKTDFQKFKNTLLSMGTIAIASLGMTACLALLDQSLLILPNNLSALLDKLVPIVFICNFFLFLITFILFGIILIKRSL
ncbi:MAG: hypothetical protein ACKUBY_03235 [Candidatus Moraniibacteriota bacterium]